MRMSLPRFGYEFLAVPVGDSILYALVVNNIWTPSAWAVGAFLHVTYSAQMGTFEASVNCSSFRSNGLLMEFWLLPFLIPFGWIACGASFTRQFLW